MITSGMQLKAKIRNIANGDGNKAQALLRNFMMERLLERISLSKYNRNFILKGGMLVSAIVGLKFRTTMDIDTTVNSLSLDLNSANKIINEILSIDICDGCSFSIRNRESIMEGFDYPGIRFTLVGSFDGLYQTIKIDISTGDVITPSAIEFTYRLMFENRSIKIYSYNIETLIAEKLETIMSRGIANTRMRDFYDIFYIWNCKNDMINRDDLAKAFCLTSKHRNSFELFSSIDKILGSIRIDFSMERNWTNYKKLSRNIDDVSWQDVNDTINDIVKILKPYIDNYLNEK